MDFVQLLELFGSGVWGTVKLFTVALVGSLVLGTILAAMRVSPTPVLRIAASTYINIVRNTPLTLVMFFCAFGLPFLDVRFGDSSSFNSFVYATLALTAYTACFVAETLKAGIQTSPSGRPRPPGRSG